MFGLGAGEALIILVFALLFIGPKKLPELARGLGKGLREFQKAKDDFMDQINEPVKSDSKPQSNIEAPKDDTPSEPEAQKNNPEKDDV